MSGIYIHIPFCKQACHYCNFHFATSLHYKKELVYALQREIELQKNYLGDEEVETIYIGGGTPSLCSAEEIKNIITQIYSSYNISTNAEVTIETNPDDITNNILQDWKDSGINRLSIGIQSFFDEDLQWMNRAHNASQAISSVQLATKQFENITIDLIYGTPTLTNEKWKQNVDTTITLNIPHISCYALTVEPKTPLEKMIRLQQTENINPDKQSEQFLLLMQWMEKAGYEHYEISNFSKPGYRSLHNSSYWQGKKYLGIGPSAHSFDINSRQWNVSNNTLYMESIIKNQIPFEKEILTPVQKLNEYIMTSLRTKEGINIKIAGEGVLTKSKKYTEAGLINYRNNYLQLTNEGKLLADGIAAALFY